MRIFQVISAQTNRSVAESQTWYRNLYEPLVDLGHDVVLFPADAGHLARKRGNSRQVARFSEMLIETFRKQHKKKPIGLFFAYLRDGAVDPTVIDEIRRAGVPTCNFSCNNAHQFYLVERLSKHFDFNLHSEKDASKKFRAVGATPVWWPMASNPTYFKPRPLNRSVNVSFVGANYGVRTRYARALLEAGIDIHLYGPGWRYDSRSLPRRWAKRLRLLTKATLGTSVANRATASAKLAALDLKHVVSASFPNSLHPPVSDDELVNLYSRSRVSLGFLEVYDGHDPSRNVVRHLHLREFEAPMCRAFYCTGFSDELAEMFEPEREVVTYKCQEELVARVQYYLDHETEAEKIREAGYQRALSDHTYHQRFKQLFNRLNLTSRSDQ